MEAATDELLNNRYQFDHLIEHRVYCRLDKMIDRNDNSPCLVKCSYDPSPAAINRYQAESRLVIEHASLPRRLGHFSSSDLPHAQFDGYHYFTVFSWMGDRTLQHRLDQDPQQRLRPETAVRYMIHICEALEVLHTSDPPIYHKHISPENIVILNNGRAALREYGQTFVSTPQILWDSLAPLGNSPYAAREQLLLNEVVDQRADVYAVGATLYHLVTGRPPITTLARQSGESLLRADGRPETVVQPGVSWREAVEANREQPVNAAHANNGVSARLASIIELAMASDPGLRYQTIAELRRALRGIRQPNDGGAGGNGHEGWFVVLAILALVVFAYMFMNDNSPDMPSTNPAGIEVGGDTGGVFGDQPAALPATPPPTLAPPTATPDVLATVAALEALLTPIAGPHTAALALSEPHRPAALDAGVILADVNATATFTNPPTAPWDYGFAFRHDPVSHFRFVAGADGSWYLIHVTETPAVVHNYVATGQSPNLRLGAGERNQLRLLTLGDAAYFFINGQYEGTASLAGKREPGRVFAATGMHPILSGTWSVSVEAFQVSSPGG